MNGSKKIRLVELERDGTGMTESRTVLFVCPHGAGKSRMAAAWFNVYAADGWRATTAGVTPQEAVSTHAPRLLRGTPAADTLDNEPPRPLTAVPDAHVVVAIDCAVGSVPESTITWDLDHSKFDRAMSDEIRSRAIDLALRLTADSD